MTVDFTMPRRVSRDSPDDDFEPIVEEPEIIEIAEQIEEIRNRCFRLEIDRNECFNKLRFSFDSEKQAEIYDSKIASNFCFWKGHRKIANNYWKQFREIEEKRNKLEAELINSEELLKFTSDAKFRLKNFWAGQYGRIYKSLENYHHTRCTIM